MSSDCPGNKAAQITDWREGRLSDVLLAMRNGTTAEQVLHTTDFPVSRIETISSGRIDRARVGYLQGPEPSFLLCSGDILYSHINSVSHIGKSAIYRGGDQLYHGMNLMLLRANAEVVLPDYLARMLEMPQSRAYARRECKPAINQASLGQRQIGSLPLLLPPLTEQRMITEILDAADEAIRSTEQLIVKLEKAKSGLLLDLLVDHSVSWSTMSVSEIALTYSGGTPPRAIPGFYRGEIPWVKSGEVNQGSIVRTEETISQAGLQVSSAHWVPPGVPLVAMYGATAGAVSWTKIRLTTNQAVLAVVPNSSQVYARWLYWSLKQSAPKILSAVQGSGQPNLSKEIIDRFKIGVPPIAEQVKIATVLDAHDAVLDVERSMLRKLITQKQGLMTDLLTGQVRVGVQPGAAG